MDLGLLLMNLTHSPGLLARGQVLPALCPEPHLKADDFLTACASPEGQDSGCASLQQGKEVAEIQQLLSD